MTEDEPFKGGEEMEPTRVPLKGPNVIEHVRHSAAARRRQSAGRRDPQAPAEPTPAAGPIGRRLAKSNAGAPGATALSRVANGSSSTSALAPLLADLEHAARLGLAAHERERDRAERGGDRGAAHAPDGALAQQQLLAGGRRLRDRRSPRRWRLGLPL